MAQYILENRQNGHCKFYKVWCYAYIDNASGKPNSAFTGFQWGKIGTSGQTKFKEFTGAHCDAKAFWCMYDKVQEKLSRGYELVKEQTK